MDRFPSLPLVSVLMPAFNHESFVRFSVESVLEQTYSNLELIVIDDASQDSTWDVVQEFNDERLQLYRHNINQGAHATLNEALGLAKGEIISIINSDDIYYPQRLELGISLLISEPSVGAVLTYYDFLDDSGNVIQDGLSLAADFPDAALDLGEVVSAQISECELQTLSLLCRNYYHTTSNMIVRRSAVEKIGLFRSYRYVHDHDFFLRLSIRYPICMIKKSLLGYRIHNANTLSESATNSVTETATMLAEFMLTNELKCLRQTHTAYPAVLGYFLNAFRGYGTERLMLMLVLSQLVDSVNRPTATPLFESIANDQVVRDRVANLLRQDQAVQDLRWQEKQTAHWWSEATKIAQEKDKLGNELWVANRELWEVKQELWRLKQENWDVKQSLWQAEQDRDYTNQQMMWIRGHAQALESSLADLRARYERMFSVRAIRFLRKIYVLMRRLFWI